MTRKKRVVILEDNPLSNALLTLIMKKKGYEVFTYENPEICPLQPTPACRCNENERCTDIILSDLHMPGMTGLDYFTTQRAKGCKCQNLGLVTSDINIDVAQRATSLSCQLFSKPFDIKELSSWLNNIEQDFDDKVTLTNWFQE